MNICILQTAPNNCEKLAEIGNTDLADRYFERYLRQHQKEYDAYVIPQVPLTRLMPRLRDMEAPVFDSIEPFIDKLVNEYDIGFEAKLVKK